MAPATDILEGLSKEDRHGLKLAADMFLKGQERNFNSEVNLFNDALAIIESILPNTDSVIKYFRQYLNMSRRDFFKRKLSITLLQAYAAQEVTARVRGRALRIALPNSFCKLEILCTIRKGSSQRAILDLDRIRLFMEKCYSPSMGRDELRSAVAHFLNHRPSPRLLPYSSITSPQQLLLGLDDPAALAKLDINLEVQFSRAHFTRIDLLLDDADPATISDLRNFLTEFTTRCDSALVGIKRKPDNG